MIQVWDTDAVSFTIHHSDLKKEFFSRFFSGEILLAAPTVLELAASSEGDGQVGEFYNTLHNSPRVLIPRTKDYFRAGRWLQTWDVQGKDAERRTRRKELAMDGLIAATAWGRGFPVVTHNVRDFAKLAAEAKGMMPGKADPAGYVPMMDVWASWES